MVTPFQRAVVFWVLVHVVAVGVLATLAFVIVAEVAERNTFPLQQPPRNISYEALASLPPSPQGTGDLFWSANASMRFERLYSDRFDRASLWICNVTEFEADDFDDVCLRVPVYPDGVPIPPLPGFEGQLYFQGNYNFPLSANASRVVPRVALIANAARGVVFAQVPFVFPPSREPSDQAGDNVVANAADLGRAYDASQMILYIGMFLLFVTALTMLMSWSTRSYQRITIILIVCIMLNSLIITLQSTPQTIRNPSRCAALGFFQHFTACSMLSFYMLSAVHFFCIIYGAGKFARFSFSNHQLVYIIVGFGFPVINSAIIWGLTPLGLSFGLLVPWSFCWIKTNTSFYVLGLSFFVPAGLVVLFNLVVSSILAAFICHVRKSTSKGLDREAVMSVIALFVSTNVGTVGFCLLGLFIILSRNANFSQARSGAILVLLSAFLFVQAFVYWIVYFCKRSSMDVWGIILTCDKGAFSGVNRPNSKVSDFSGPRTGLSTASTASNQKLHSTASADSDSNSRNLAATSSRGVFDVSEL